MRTAVLEPEPKVLSSDEKFSILLKRLHDAGYDLDIPEANRIRREFDRGRYGEVK